jgi:type I restriction enzyme S subunit
MKLNIAMANSSYVFYSTKTRRYQSWVVSESARTGQPGLNLSQLKCFQISFPKDKSEQIRIATALSNIDALISELGRLIDKKRAIKQGAMQQLLTGKKRLKGFEGEWCEKKLGEIAEFRRGAFPQPYGLPQWYGGLGALPFVQVADVSDKSFVLNQRTQQTISVAAQPMSVFVPKGKVIVSLQGSIGKVAITQYDSYVDRTLAIFENYKIPIDIVFFAFKLSEKFMNEAQKAPGGIIKTITKEVFSDFTISLPQTLGEQCAISKILSDMDSDISKLEAKKLKYTAIKQGMMQQLLTGKIRLTE